MAADPDDPRAVMTALQQRLHDQRAFAWLDHFHLTELAEQQVTLEPAPGQRGLLRMVNDTRKQQIADELADILGRTVRVHVREPNQPADPPTVERAEQAPGPAQAAAAPSTSASAGKSARQAAMHLPLVREVFEQFPNASLTDVQQEAAPSPGNDDSTNQTNDPDEVNE